MSDVMNQPLPADVQEIAAGHGRHRGEVSTQDSDAAPRGRHRKPADESESTAA
ncbi:hypothetical protein [Streptomyces sp. DH24]|uniref:hypothetical protein n=1 Tax=Streptomyces sp. DH24 TaxID=3040123 RepID=UPI002442FE44|nr:hypothetical protein [Streptomyces sp. DH24]MDG9716029.1 hypothetical protein [Streptomyces sp. DH24]